MTKHLDRRSILKSAGLITAGSTALGAGILSPRSPSSVFAQETGCAVVNVKDFGAVGDGVANDTTAIQDALDSLLLVERQPPFQPGPGVLQRLGPVGTVYFPRGKYKITNSLEVPRRRTNSSLPPGGQDGWMAIRIAGEGFSSGIINKSAGPAIMVGAPGTGGLAWTFEIAHLAIIGNDDGPMAPGIQVHTGGDAYIHDLTILAYGTGIDFKGFNACTIERVHIWPEWGIAIYNEEIPDPTRAGIGFNFVSSDDATSRDGNNIISIRDCAIDVGTKGMVFEAMCPKGLAANVFIDGGHIQNISEDAISILAPFPDLCEADPPDITAPNFHIQNFFVEFRGPSSLPHGLPGAQPGVRFLNAKGADFLAVQNISISGDTEVGRPNVTLNTCQRVLFVNITGGAVGVLDFVSERSAEVTDFTSINGQFQSVNPVGALDMLRSRLIIGGNFPFAENPFGLRVFTPPTAMGEHFLDGQIAVKEVQAEEIHAKRVFTEQALEFKPASGVFFAFPATDQPVLPNTPTKVIFDTEEYDPDGVFSTSTSSFVAPQSGFYRLTVGVHLEGVKPRVFVSIMLKRNSLDYRILANTYAPQSPALSNGLQFGGSSTVRAAVGDHFEVYVQHANKKSVTVLTGNPSATFFEGEFVGL